MKNSEIIVVSEHYKDLKLTPSDFAQEWVVRHLAGIRKIAQYVERRAIGFGQSEVAAQIFSGLFIGHPDAIKNAMENFESTQSFRLRAEVAFEQIPAETLRNAWSDISKIAARLSNEERAVIDSCSGFVEEFNYSDYTRSQDAEQADKAEQACRATLDRPAYFSFNGGIEVV